MNNKETINRNIQFLRDKLNSIVEDKEILSTDEILEISSLLDNTLNELSCFEKNNK